MSVETSGPAATLARMAAIQSTIASVSGTTARATGTGATTSFDSVYGSALGGAGATSATGLASAGGNDVGSRAVAAASQYLGVPYVWGGTDPAKGLDCSGLVQRAYAEVGVSLPRVADDQARMGTAVPDLAHAQPGDLLAFNSPVSHIGIYVGDGKMIAAPKAGDVVKIQDVYKTPSAIRRIGASVTPGAVGVAGLGGTAGLAGTAGATGAAASGAPAALQNLFASATSRYGLPQGLLAAVAKHESGFDTRAVSPAGAQGLMQLMPATARGLGVDPLVPAQAVDGAARMLARDLDRFGSVGLAVAAYNAGAGAVQRYGGVPPYTETQQYVRRVLGSMGVSR